MIGEMHSNVWDHGQQTGFSMAQRTKVSLKNDYNFEFALADCGMGLKTGMERCGMSPASDQEAIEWCIQEGNTTKKSDDRDEFAQRLPEEHIGGTPFGESVHVFHSDGAENHHLGLGLAKLISLVIDYKGELCLASGNCGLYVDENGSQEYFPISRGWKGVALSCRLRASNFQSHQTETSAEITALASQLRG